MKKKLMFIVVGVIVLFTICSCVFAEENISVKLDGQQLVFDVQPQLMNGRTMVPMRKIFESLGASVVWDDATQTITSTKGKDTIILTIGQPNIKINEQISKELDVAPCLVDGRTLVPVRAISEALHMNVDWDDKTQTVLITSSNIEYMQNIADTANGYRKENALSFLWVTDTHATEKNTHIASKVAQMTKYFPCEYVAHTGDIIDGVSKKDKELSILTTLNTKFLDSNCPVFYVKGNHDDNCLYARKNGKLGEHYILDKEIYERTLAFNESAKTPDGNDKLYYYYDDENTKIRSIFVNVFDCSEECDENGVRLYDARAQAFSQEQLNWLKHDALNFSAKENSEEWAIIIFSHMYMNKYAYRILGDFQNGKNTFAEQGAGEVIAWFVGDDHLDTLSYYNWTYDNFKTCRVGCLNASSAKDNTEDAKPDNTILYPPSKPANTENETAFDLVTIDRDNGLIYLTRYGARSYVYNQETSTYDIRAARTRIIDYKTGQYTKILD